MAEQEENDDPTNTHRITPRDVEPESQTSGGGAKRDRSTGNDRGRSLRDDDLGAGSGSADQAGIAGGGVDDSISGLGGDKSRR